MKDLENSEMMKLAKLTKLQGEFMTKVCEIIEDKETQIRLTNKMGEFIEIEVSHVMK